MEAVREAFWVQANAVKAKDAELLVSTWADDLISSRGDKEATRDRFTNRFAQGRYEDDFSIDKIEISMIRASPYYQHYQLQKLT